MNEEENINPNLNLKNKFEILTYLRGGNKKKRRRSLNFQSFKPHKVEDLFFFFPKRYIQGLRRKRR